MAAPRSVDPARAFGFGEPGFAPGNDCLVDERDDVAQADQVCGAGYGERVNRRNGYRMREWDTRAGTVKLAVPKLREGSFYPDWLLTHRRRAEQALVTVVATAYLLGVSTRWVERLAEQLGVIPEAFASQRDGCTPRWPSQRARPGRDRGQR
jgi:putative transposase